MVDDARMRVAAARDLELVQHPVHARGLAREKLKLRRLDPVTCFGFEQRRFKGPPMGEIIAARQAAIAEAEKAVGER